MNSRDSDLVRACLARHAARKPVVEYAHALQAYLAADTLAPETIIETDGRAIVVDLGTGSRELGADFDALDVQQFSALIDRAMARNDTAFAFGRWGERRALYNNEHFSAGSDESRTVHMGIDVFCTSQTMLRAPLDGVVEIVANNRQELDYGPLVVLRHASPDGHAFFTLFGHLDLQSTRGLRPGQAVAAAEPLAAVGAPPENGNWPPHLHFQIILDLLGLGADFPGVARRSQQDAWLALSPSPAVFFPEIGTEALDGRGNDASQT